jgi:hypothetical protein
MSTNKIAITVPEDVIAAVDAAAKERGESRSGFISRVLRAALRARRDAAITRRLDELFRNEDVAAEQRRLTHEMNSAGTDWSNEVW